MLNSTLRSCKRCGRKLPAYRYTGNRAKTCKECGIITRSGAMDYKKLLVKYLWYSTQHPGELLETYFTKFEVLELQQLNTVGE